MSVSHASEVNGRRLTFAPSGLIYRSSTLRHDEETHAQFPDTELAE